MEDSEMFDNQRRVNSSPKSLENDKNLKNEFNKDLRISDMD